MGMIRIDMLMPENCSECRFKTKREFCKAMPDNFCGCTDDKGRPEWCPLEQQPEIVRCRDCTFRNEVNCPAYYRRSEPPDDWFCADGKRQLSMATKREKVIKGLETCYCPPSKCEDCPYNDVENCNDTLCLDAIALLKQEKE